MLFTYAENYLLSLYKSENAALQILALEKEESLFVIF